MPVQKIKQKPFNSLRKTLIFAFLGLVLAVLFVTLCLQIYSNFQTNQKALASQQYLTAQIAAGTVDNFMQSKLAILSQASDINDLATSPDRRALVMGKLMGENPSFRQLLLIDAQGIELQRNSRLSASAAETFGQFKEKILASAAKGEQYISPVYIDAVTSEPLVIISVPIKNVFHESLGAFAAEVNLKFMWDLVSNIKVGTGGLAYVVDSAGNLLAFRDSSRVLRKENLQNLKEVSQFMSGLTESLDQGPDVYTGILGNTVVSTYATLNATNWAGVIEVPLFEAYQPVIRLGLISLLGMLLSTILALFAAFYLSRRITKPIVALRDAAIQISKGRFNDKIEIISNNEIGQLAGTFNLMTGQLQDSYGKLETKVEEKTRDLNMKVGELEKIRSANLNILEDLAEEKKMVEIKVGERTKELKAESAMLESQNLLFESFLYNLPIGALLLDIATNSIVLANNFAMLFLELPLDVIRKKKNYFDLVVLYREDGSLYSDQDRPITKAIKEDRIISEQVFFHRRDGSKQPLRVHVAPVADGKGLKVSAIVLIEDITQEYEIDKTKSEFVSLASHQLRTPLSSINWYTEMLESGDAGKLNSEQKDFLKEISTSARHMADLVTTLLNVSRIDMGTFVIDPVPANICDLVASEIEQLKLQIKEKSLDFEFDCEVKKKNLKVDAKVFSIVIQNLLTNAIKYTPVKGKVVVSINEDKKTDSCIIAVVDNGFGIPKEQQNKIFDKFFRADNVRGMEIDGNGLGLYLVKSIVEKAGCKIWFESKGKKGTTFYISIPNSGMIKKSGIHLLGELKS